MSFSPLRRIKFLKTHKIFTFSTVSQQLASNRVGLEAQSVAHVNIRDLLLFHSLLLSVCLSWPQVLPLEGPQPQHRGAGEGEGSGVGTSPRIS